MSTAKKKTNKKKTPKVALKNQSATAKIKASKATKPARKSSKAAKTSKEKKVTIKNKSVSDRLLGAVKSVVDKVSDTADGLVAAFEGDIVSAIKEDHDALRNFLGILKDTSESMTKRRAAYEDFSDLLKSHTVAEENAVYNTGMKLPGKEMHIKMAEGFVEHQLADDLMRRMEETEDSLAWSAHANVLSEIVEHHLKEEERDLLPEVRRAADLEVNMTMLAEFLSLRGKTQEVVKKDNAGALEQLEGK